MILIFLSRLIVNAVSVRSFFTLPVSDPLCLSVAGFDQTTPAIIADFVAGRF